MACDAGRRTKVGRQRPRPWSSGAPRLFWLQGKKNGSKMAPLAALVSVSTPAISHPWCAAKTWKPFFFFFSRPDVLLLLLLQSRPTWMVTWCKLDNLCYGCHSLLPACKQHHCLFSALHWMQWLVYRQHLACCIHNAESVLRFQYSICNRINLGFEWEYLQVRKEQLDPAWTCCCLLMKCSVWVFLSRQHPLEHTCRIAAVVCAWCMFAFASTLAL